MTVRQHFDPRTSVSMLAALEPFATRLQCLVCGAYWWRAAGAEAKCPTASCAPKRVVLEDGTEATEYGIVRDVAATPELDP
jgi:hypothetical protein